MGKKVEKKVDTSAIAKAAAEAAVVHEKKKIKVKPG